VKNELAKRLVSLLSFWLAFWPAGISGLLSEQHPQAEAQSRARDAPWEVSIGSRGGVTGGASGHLIRSDGEVYSWTQATVESARVTRRLGRATPDTLHALEQAVTAPALAALRHLEAGNMTRVLDWRQGADVREYTWAEEAGTQPLPAPLRRAYDAALAVVTFARP